MTLSVRSPNFSHVAMANAMSEGPFGWSGTDQVGGAKQRQSHAVYPSLEQEATTSIHYTPQAPLIWMLAPFT